MSYHEATINFYEPRDNAGACSVSGDCENCGVELGEVERYVSHKQKTPAMPVAEYRHLCTDCAYDEITNSPIPFSAPLLVAN